VKKFRLKADIELEATDIDDAMIRIAEHLLHVVDGLDSQLILSGSFHINPAGDEGAV